MMNAPSSQLFSRSSTTYFNASRFFPADVRADVTTLYNFVRTGDNYVDFSQPDPKGFADYRRQVRSALSGKQVTDPVVQAFVKLAERKQIDEEWIMSFLSAMASDLEPADYQTYEQLEHYMYGSAAVVGLMMAKILDLPDASLPYAQKQGEAMQLINFVRDVAEDWERGRIYIPQEDRERFGVNTWSPKDQNEEAFTKLLRFEVDRYTKLQQEAVEGYRYIPKRFLVPIKTAADMYSWTAEQLAADPVLVWRKQLKPSRTRVLMTGVWNWWRL